MTDRPRRYWGFVSALPAPIITMIARQAEAQGLTGVFAPQVYGPPWIPLAVAAAATERVRIASGIAIASVRSPFETAMAAIDMDRVSNGRFTLGLGASVLSWSQGIFGAAPHRPLAHLRETVAAVRHIVKHAHRGLPPFRGEYYNADFAEFQGSAPPVREEIPIWVAALRGPMVRLAGEIADGVMGHPIWSIDWAVEKIRGDLAAGLKKAGRRREDVDLNLWLWCAPNEDEREAIEDARPTVAFYAGVAQYESFFEAHGFGREARALQARAKTHDLVAATALVPDAMVRTFVLLGSKDRIRAGIERAWTVADSMVLVPPAYALPPEKLAHYAAAIAEFTSA